MELLVVVVKTVLAVEHEVSVLESLVESGLLVENVHEERVFVHNIYLCRYIIVYRGIRRVSRTGTDSEPGPGTLPTDSTRSTSLANSPGGPRSPRRPRGGTDSPAPAATPEQPGALTPWCVAGRGPY